MNKKRKLSDADLFGAPPAHSRIKDVRGRKRAMTPSTAPGSQSFGNAFSSAPAPSFGGNPFSSTPSLQPTGFAFGQSQSFPGANANSSLGQPQQDGSAPFSFGGASQGGFGFSAPSFGQQTNSFAANNPFVNGTSSSQPAEPAQPTGMFSFGGNSAFNASPVTQPAAQPSGMFGAPQTTSAPAPPNMFGKPATTTTAVDSMQTSPDAKPKASAPASTPGFQNRNLFGGAGTPSLTPSAPSTPAANPFTNLNVASTTSKPAETQPFKNLFGAAPAAPKVSEPSQPAANNVFAPKTATEQAPSPPVQAKPFGSSVFGSAPTTAKTSESQQPAQPAPANIFAPKTAAEQAPAKPAESKPFGNLFGGAPAASKAQESSTQPAPSNMFASAPASKAPEPSTQPAPANIFAPKPAAEQTAAKPAESKPFGNLFGGAPAASKAPEPSAQPAPSNIFAPKPATGQTPAFANVMGGGISAPQATQPSAQPAPTNLFAPKPATAQAAPQNQQPFGNLFGGKPVAAAVPAAKETSAPAVPAAPAAQPFQLSKPQLPSSMSEEQAEDAELLLQLRTLNESLKQGVSKRSATDDFDSLIMYYLQVRETLGVPVFPNHSGAETTTTNGPVASAQDDSSTASVFANSFSAPKTDSSKQPAPAPTQSASTPTTATPAAAPKFGNKMFAKATSGASTSASAANAAPSPPSDATTSAPALAIPKFGNGASGTDFMAQFKKQADKAAAEEKAKRKAEDFDSDEDDEEEWERKDAERQREKRAKIEAASKKKTKFVPGKGFMFVDDVDEPAASTEAAKESSAPSPTATPLFGKRDEASKIGSSNEASVISNASSRAASPATSIFASANQPLPNSQNIFGSLSATPQTSDKDDGDSSSGDDIHEAIRKTPKRRPSAEDREADDDRPSKRTINSSDAATSKSSLDAPLPAPSAAAGRSLFDRVQTPGRSATSSPNPFGGLMGGNATTNNATSSLFTGVNTSGTSTPIFGASQTADQTWKPNTPIKFAAESVPSTEIATSADVTGDEEEGEPGAIFNLTNAKSGEEEEDAVYECRARAFKRDGSWKSQGTGICRLLVHRETHAARVVIRADPGGNIILNTHLKRDYAYSKAGNSVQLMVPHHNKQPEHWAIRTKAENVTELFSKIEEIKN
ncbi:hypothetical protein N7474_006390 [Penicillium riverlandense]|uniref:uncharacterized protein n=1 Tax=Penicillium riverlandense TaxID=1903569 RepID=UPI002549B9DF|nr:uncharacterized protein N7474_006390 [Penicillium riverlandense]KAJ5814613.1 hypothetical protein N7474_006390 [Penicillium riverlandense]